MKLDFRIQVIIIFLLSAAVTGIVGNRADDFVVEVLPGFLSKPVVVQRGWLFFVVAWAIFLPSVIYVRYRAALRNVSNLTKIGDRLSSHILSLYTALPNSVTAEKNAKEVAKILFQDIIKDRPFDDCGIAIYTPNSTQTYLNAWQWYSTPNHASETVAFYVGGDDGKNKPSSARGMVGTAFMQEKTQVFHFNKDGSADDNRYLPYSNGRASYRSFICEPIIISLKTNQRIERRKLGVLCLYSPSRNTFDNSGIQVTVKALAYRFSVVLMSFS